MRLRGLQRNLSRQVSGVNQLRSARIARRRHPACHESQRAEAPNTLRVTPPAASQRTSELQRRAYARIREAEVVHARWAMLGVSSLLVADATGGAPLQLLPAAAHGPMAAGALLLLAAFELQRVPGFLSGGSNTPGSRSPYATDSFEERTYPGRLFDFLHWTRPAASPREAAPGLGAYAPWLGGVAGWLAGGWWFASAQRSGMTARELSRLKASELQHGRMAMMAALACCTVLATTGKGPYTALMDWLATGPLSPAS